jgi:hypothetical protein
MTIEEKRSRIEKLLEYIKDHHKSAHSGDHEIDFLFEPKFIHDNVLYQWDVEVGGSLFHPHDSKRLTLLLDVMTDDQIERVWTNIPLQLTNFISNILHEVDVYIIDITRIIKEMEV